LSLFCGAGGLDLGARDAGVEVVACWDSNEDAVATARAAGFPAEVRSLPAYGPLDQAQHEALGRAVLEAALANLEARAAS